MSQPVLMEAWQLQEQLCWSQEDYLLLLGRGRVKGRSISGILAAELPATSTSCWGMWLAACVSNIQTVQLEERFHSCCHCIARKIEVISLFPWLFIWSLISFLVSGKQDSGRAQMCPYLSSGASVQEFYPLPKFWAHYFLPINTRGISCETQIFNETGFMDPSALKMTDFFLVWCEWQDFILPVVFSLTLSHPSRKDAPPFLRADRGERKGALSSSFYWKLRCIKNIQKNTVVYPFGKWNDLGAHYQFITWV